MKSDTISLKRMRLLARFYMPAISRQLAICGPALAVAYVTALLSLHAYTCSESHNGYILLYSFAIWLAGILYPTAPLVLAFCRRRDIVTTLPASDTEKFLVVMIYVFVVFPAFLAAIWYGLRGICSLFSPLADVTASVTRILENDSNINLSSFAGASTLSDVAINMMTAAAGTYFITAVRRQRFAIGIASIIGAMFAVWLFGMALSIYSLLTSGFISAIKNNPEINPDQFVGDLMQTISDAIPAYAFVCFVATAVFIVLTYRKIKTRQF